MNKRIRKKKLCKELIRGVTNIHPEKDDIIVIKMDYTKLKEYTNKQVVSTVLKKLSDQIKKVVIVLPMFIDIESIDKKELKNELLRMVKRLDDESDVDELISNFSTKKDLQNITEYMRDATEEEITSVNDYIKSISEPLQDPLGNNKDYHGTITQTDKDNGDE